VIKTLHANAETARRVAATVLDELHNVIGGGQLGDESRGEEVKLLLEEVGSMKNSIMPRSVETKEEDRKKLAYILPEYFSD